MNSSINQANRKLLHEALVLLKKQGSIEYQLACEVKCNTVSATVERRGSFYYCDIFQGHSRVHNSKGWPNPVAAIEAAEVYLG
jgi:hypothetical protein